MSLDLGPTIADLKRDEGFSATGYPDPDSPLGEACREAKIEPERFRDLPGWQALRGSPWTVGYGCTGPQIGQDTVWTDEEAQGDLAARVTDLAAELARALAWFPALAEPRASALVNMAYNMGFGGLLGFHDTLTLMASANWQAASVAMLESKWARQLPERAARLSNMVRTGLRTIPAGG